MSLYYDAASILTGDVLQGSLRSRIYNANAGLKAKPAHVYALISECAKYDSFLKEVIDKAGILAHEPKLSPLLCLLLVHDHLFAKGGIAASASHPLKITVERNKARLHAEFTKARLRRRCGSVDELKKALSIERRTKSTSVQPQPRWVRINTLRSSLSDLQTSVFEGFAVVDTLAEVMNAQPSDCVLYTDPHVPHLIAVPPDTNLTRSEAYARGEIMLQDKASCFPAQLLLGYTEGKVGDFIDGCAAPGNKTTHLAAISAARNPLEHSIQSRIYACERDAARSTTLQKMVKKAGADQVEVLDRQDFLALNPHDDRFANVTHLLLDPSCSGSGILGREDVPKLDLPSDLRGQSTPKTTDGKSKKRKRVGAVPEQSQSADNEEEQPQPDVAVDHERLRKLADIQSRIVEHAMSFPAARHITYSTCSIHCEENEMVVARLLRSTVGRSRGWQVLKHVQQSQGLKLWPYRGIQPSTGTQLSEDELEGCIRCHPNDVEGTMGFFVVGFERDETSVAESHHKTGSAAGEVARDMSEDEWDGFSDS